MTATERARGAARHYLFAPEVPPTADTVVVLESEIGQPPDYWHLLVAELAARAVPCLARVRPGYVWTPRRDAVSLDAADLERIADNSTTIVTVAHSFGALLALRGSGGQLVAGRSPDALLLLDAVTPQMVSEVRMNRFALGRLRRSFGITAFSTALGLGPLSELLDSPYRSYPTPVQRRCRTFRYSPRNARQAQREFNRVIHDDAVAAPVELPELTLVVHAETGLPDPDGYAAYQHTLARDLALPESAVIKLGQVRQKGLLTSPDAMSSLATAIQNVRHGNGLGSTVSGGGG